MEYCLRAHQPGFLLPDMGRFKFKRSQALPTIPEDNRSVTGAYTSRTPVGSFEPTLSSSMPSREESSTSYSEHPVPASSVLISQSSAQGDRDSVTSDCSWDWECSSEEDDLDLRRICRSQEDLSTQGSSGQAWELPLCGKAALPPSPQPCSASHGEKLVNAPGGITAASPEESVSQWLYDNCQGHASRGSLLWQGPSTYVWLCEQRAKDNDEGSRTVEFRYSYPDDYTPDVAFKSTKHVRPRKDSREPDVPALGDFPAQAPSGSQLEAAHQTVQPVLPDQVDATSDISLLPEVQPGAGTRNSSSPPSPSHLLADGSHEIPKSSPAAAVAATVGSRMGQ